VLEERLDALQMGISAKIKMGRKVRKKGSIINVGVAKPKGRATPNIFCKLRKKE
jgi:hypothetical protein